MKYTLVLVDDELDSQITLKSFIEEFCPNINVTGVYDSVSSCINHLLTSPPDILLLDINLPDGTGFDVLEKIASSNIRTIFITAYDQHAIDAFKFKVDNYLLKPVNPNRLQEAIDQVISTISDMYKLHELQLLEDHTNIKKLGIPARDSIHLMNLNEIVRCEANGNYTYIHIIEKESILVPKTIKKFEEILEPHEFIRCHQSHLINQNFVKEIQHKENIILLRNGDKIPISRKQKREIIQLFKLKIV